MNENQLGVLLENILDKVGVIAEGQRILEKKFETLAQSQQVLEKKFDTLAEGQKTLENKIESLTKSQKLLENKMDIRFNAVEQRLYSVESDIKGLKKDSIIIKNYLMTIEDDLNDHERRIQVSEEAEACGR
ncbi:MAG: hypothetical protein GX930_06345 [Clostridia bacterium]|jgi:flagellar capping protein FliD|nr:hypothetical protein [Clostridia bacterium]